MELLVIYIWQVGQNGIATKNMVWCGSLFSNFILSNNGKIEVSNLPYRPGLLTQDVMLLHDIGISHTAAHA
jgi:hypothetical protein